MTTKRGRSKNATIKKKTISRKKSNVKKKTVRKKKKVLKKTIKPKQEVPKEKVVSKIKKEQKEPVDLGRRSLRRVIAILGDAYVRQMLIEVGGENALAIVRNFQRNSSDEDLAKKLKIKISDVRATLNRLHNEGLVNYSREKDSETGWYSYNWSLNHERMERWATDHTNKIDLIGNGNEYYFCPSCGEATITEFEAAVNGDFRCERCNRLLEFIDEKRTQQLYEKRRL